MKTEELGLSLLRALAELPDPRSRPGRRHRHPVPAVLTLAVVARLSPSAQPVGDDSTVGPRTARGDRAPFPGRLT